MNQELRDMAEKCGLLGKEPYLGGMYSNALKAFAALVAAAEREACAKVCDELPAPDIYSDTDKSMWEVTCTDCGDAIRARGETK
jgi:hypothetical protein